MARLRPAPASLPVPAPAPAAVASEAVEEAAAPGKMTAGGRQLRASSKDRSFSYQEKVLARSASAAARAATATGSGSRAPGLLRPASCRLRRTLVGGARTRRRAPRPQAAQADAELREVVVVPSSLGPLARGIIRRGGGPRRLRGHLNAREELQARVLGRLALLLGEDGQLRGRIRAEFAGTAGDVETWERRAGEVGGIGGYVRWQRAAGVAWPGAWPRAASSPPPPPGGLEVQGGTEQCAAALCVVSSFELRFCDQQPLSSAHDDTTHRNKYLCR